MDNKKSLIEEQLDALGDIKGDTVPAEQVRAFVGLIKEFFAGNFHNIEGMDLDPELYGELGELALFINTARKELSALTPGMLHEEHIPDASDQLDEIVKTTEKATHKIVDSCEQLQGITLRLRDRIEMIDPPLDPDVSASMEDALLESDTHITNIYEACNFQDLTGQRIQKIVTVLREIERQVFRMVVVFGLRDKGEALSEEDKSSLESGAELLSGPAKEGEGLEQDDIDDILAKLL